MIQSKLRRRALILEPSGNLWGSERVLLDFLSIASNSESGWQIAVCCPPDTPILEPLGAMPVEVISTFQANLHLHGRAQRLRATLALLRAAWKFKARLIYVNQAGATRIALTVGRLLRIPVITHVRLAEDVGYVSSLKADKRALPKVLCISQTVRQMFDKQQGVSPAQLEMIYDAYAMQTKAGNYVSGVSFLDHQPAFSCVGRLEYNKKQDVLLRAIEVLKQRGILTQGLLLGVAKPDDSFGPYLHKLCAELDIESQVTWAGFQSEVFPWLARSSALVCPFQNEALGRVVFEAWDAGTIPVAWAGSGGPAEVILQSGGGLLYEEQSGESLATTLEIVLGMKAADKTAMIEAGRSWLHANCEPSTYTHQMLSWWEQAGGLR